MQSCITKVHVNSVGVGLKALLEQLSYIENPPSNKVICKETLSLWLKREF